MILVLLIIIFSILTQNFIAGLLIAFIYHFLIKKSQGMDKSTHSSSNKSNRLLNKYSWYTDSQSDDLVSINIHQESFSKKGSKIPPRKENFSKAIYEKP